MSITTLCNIFKFFGIIAEILHFSEILLEKSEYFVAFLGTGSELLS